VVGIVTTLRAPGREMAIGFVRYHLAIGFDRLYLYWDDPDEAIPPEILLPEVTHVRAGAALRARQRGHALWPDYAAHVDEEVVARQMLNVESAIAQARADGLRWLLHIDGDELFAAREGVQAHFAALDRSPYDAARYLNLEAVPERMEIGDPFREITLFRVNNTLSRNTLPFLGYNTGKSAVRLVDGILPDGPHLFTRHRQDIPCVVAVDPAILHYVSCGYRRWREKYQLLGRFPDRWFGVYPIQLPFHLESRDVVARRDEEAARAFYRERVVMSDPEEIAREIARGALERRTGPREVLAT
jgi:glycosyl transferase family 2